MNPVPKLQIVVAARLGLWIGRGVLLGQRLAMIAGSSYSRKSQLDQTIDHCQITPTGWDYLDKAERRTLDSSQAFVAMWFNPSMDSAWNYGIKPALESAAYMPYRVDNDLSDLGRIDAKIEVEIKRSRFLVADVTGGRQGVYYEAGYAMGLGLPVIWSVRSDRKDDMHFDTQQYNVVVK